MLKECRVGLPKECLSRASDAVVEEYQSSLMELADLLQEQDVRRIPQRVHSWVVGALEVSIPEIEEPMRYLEGLLNKYLPNEHDENQT